MPRKIKANSPRAKLKTQMPMRIAAVIGGTAKARKQIAQDVQSALDNLNHVRTYPAGLNRNEVTMGPLTDEDADIMIGTVDNDDDDDET
jgi:hypothetical protein